MSSLPVDEEGLGDLEDGATSREGSTSPSSQDDDKSGRTCSGPFDPILEAFLEMEPRKLRRTRYSRVPARTLTHNVRQALQGLIVLLLLANTFKISVHSKGLQKYYQIPIIVTVFFVFPTVVQTFQSPEHTFTAWVSTEVNVFCLWIVWQFREVDGCDSDEGLGEKRGKIRVAGVCIPNDVYTIAQVFAVILGVTVLCYFIKFVVVECSIRFRCCRRFAALHWHIARRSRQRPGLTTFSYLSRGWLDWAPAEFTYCGASDEDGRPHGFGIWCDTSFHGECLRGYWVHGRPVGSFTSRETGSGAQFLQRAVGYVTSRDDCRPNKISRSSMLPRKTDYLRYGHGQVEVSFAGGFFPFLPSVEHHHTDRSVAALAKVLSSPSGDRSSASSAGGARRALVKLEVLDEDDLPNCRSDESASGILRSAKLSVQYVDGNSVAYVTPEALSEACGLRTQTRGEALVFIHGYNCDLTTALGRVAQTLALGNMSPHIVPFVFSYSAGGVLQYFSAKAHMREYGDDLASFFRSPSQTCSSPPGSSPAPGLDQAGGVPLGQRAATGDSRLHLATLTMMNPDVLVAKVVELLPEVMRAAEHFTTYNDADDGALFYSRWLQKLVPRWYQERPWSEETEVFGRLLRSFWVERDGNGCVLRGDLVSGANNLFRMSSSTLGAEMELPWRSSPHVPGDGSIEVINCSTIDQNVHKLRHNYYMLNTQMVEDVCELIGERRTARYRQRLCQVNANIYNFLSPPSYLKE
eukprot:CAMPEP_0175530914 /NCGR_PEP_ID=MMETSP0096-20121207/21901_1 /TAXON_ID=311494 /ORGANISM="Alexandrium monilatum, Strain CCMP3105" /LENGTH=747 /DNA_ID=CAMNT_0016833639 /DNA_START=1 /DNA_END=2243 /DNA_ORIENTATION=+